MQGQGYRLGVISASHSEAASTHQLELCGNLHGLFEYALEGVVSGRGDHRHLKFLHWWTLER